MNPSNQTGIETGVRRRPALLMRAGRIASRSYRRKRDLARILGTDPPQDPSRALGVLDEIEAGLDRLRRQGGRGYLPSAHVAVLAALIAETAAAAEVR